MDKWIKIGFVPGFGTTTEPKTYSFTDNNVSSGIYKYRLKQIDFDGSFEYSNEIAIEAGFMPNGYALFQNYPNPFNPSTQIKFSVPKQTQLKINLYNVIGELVKTITEGLYEAGYHQTTLDAHNLPSGIYIYRLESNDLMQSRKMIILK